MHAIALVAGLLGGFRGDPVDAKDWFLRQLSSPPTLVASRDIRLEYLSVVPASKRKPGDNGRDGTMPEYPGKSVTRFTLRWADEAHWRLSADFPNLGPGAAQFADNVRGGEDEWLAGPGQLTLTRSAWGFPNGMGNKFAMSEAVGRSRILLDGMLSPLPGHTHVLTSFTRSGDRFTAAYSDTQGSGASRMHVQGSWDGGLGRGFVLRHEVVSSDFPGTEGETAVFSGWREAWAGGPWMAGSVEFSSGFGRSTVAGVRFERAPREEILASLTAPKDGVDAVRGRVAFGAIEDYRTTRPVGTNPSMPGARPRALAQLPGMDRGLERLAWSLAGALVGVLVLIRASRGVRAFRASRRKTA